MKRKGTDRFPSKSILAKSHKYASPGVEKEYASVGDRKANEPLRKATEADKERKREKARLKRQQKRELKAQSSLGNNNAKADALAYLLSWKQNRSQWTFKKNKQCWLLRNIYNIDHISNEDFEILLEYLMGLQGAARVRLVEEAEQKMNLAEKSEFGLHENEDESETNKNGTNEKTQKIVERARSILQTIV